MNIHTPDINRNKNLFYSLLSYGLKIFNNLILFALLARIVSIDVFGIIVFLIVLVKIADKIIESGHKLIIVKEISANNKLLTLDYIGEKISYKTILLALVAAGILLYGSANDYWGYHPLILISVVLAGYFSALSNINIALFHVHSKFHLETISLAILSLLLVIFLALTWTTNDEQYFIIGYSVGSAVMYFLTCVLLNKNIIAFKLDSIYTKLKISSFPKVLKYTIPFALIIVVEVLMGNFDIFFVEHTYTNEELGAYTGLKKILAGLSLFMLICSDYLMPRISRMNNAPATLARNGIIKYFAILCILGAVIFLAYWTLDFLIIKILLGPQFLVIEKWDINIGIIIIAMYARVIPNLYFISFGYEKHLLKFYSFFLFIGSLYFYFNIIPGDIKSAVNAFTVIQIIISIIYIIFFLRFMFSNSKE